VIQFPTGEPKNLMLCRLNWQSHSDSKQPSYTNQGTVFIQLDALLEHKLGCLGAEPD